MSSLIPRRDWLDETRPMELLEQMRQLFDESRSRASLGRDLELLAVDVRRDGETNEMVAEASLPGYSIDEVTVEVEKGVPSIRAEKSEESEEEKDGYYRRERRFGSTSRRVTLPAAVNDEAAKATLKDGVLRVRIPIAEEAEIKQVAIEAG